MTTKGNVHVPFGSTDGEVLPKSLSSPATSIPFVIARPIDGGAAASDDYTVEEKIRVIDVWAVHIGGAGEASDTLQVLNGSNAITDAMDWSGADKAIVRAGEIDDAYHEIAKGGTLRITTVDSDAGDDVGAGVVYVLAVKVK
jgi:hypothetical protein